MVEKQITPAIRLSARVVKLRSMLGALQFDLFDQLIKLL
jgi:hypothetical protein